MKGYILPSVSVLVLALATVSIVRSQPTRQLTEPPAPPPQSAFAERVSAVGLVEAGSENISIASHLSGVVERVFVTAGQDVKLGDPLVKLDTRALEAALSQRKSDVAASRAAVLTARAQTRKAGAALADVRRNLSFAESVTDARSISSEELARRKGAVEIAEAELSSAEAGVVSAEASVQSALAAQNVVETEIARSTVTSPVEGRVLQSRIRAGEFAPAGVAAQSWLVLGTVKPLHIRVDVDEHEAWRVKPGARATAQVRGNAAISSSLKFVRFEPYVIPKQSLTGSVTERVDTRVLQILYSIDSVDLPVFVGQQMDVFIDAGGQTAAAKN